MRVGILTELMDERPAGMGSYVRSLVSALLEVDRDTDYVLIHAQKGGHPVYDEAEEVVVGSGTMGRVGRKVTNYPRAVREAGLDLVHYPDYFGPFLRKPPCLAVETIHDLVPFVMPDTHQWDVNFTFRKIFPRFIAPKVDHFIAVSGNTKADMMEHMDIDPSRVTVVPEAADPSFRPVKGAELDGTLEEHGLSPGYILTVGTLEPRKNVSRLLEAYARLHGKGLKRKLVLVGKKGWKYESIFETKERLGLETQVVHLDYLPFSDLPAVYSGASLMVYPSLYEGFGLPPLEAMACGTPVVTSGISSLPEVVGDAAFMVEPTDVEALAGAMEKILKNDDISAKLVKDGLARAAQFTWKKTAKQTAEVYRRVAGKDE